MELDKLTIGEARELQKLFSAETQQNLSKSHPYKIGQNYLIQTVTHYFTGRLDSVHEHEIVLGDKVAWIANTGRYADAIKNGFQNSAEIEPIETGSQGIPIGRGSIICAIPWERELPSEQK